MNKKIILLIFTTIIIIFSIMLLNKFRILKNSKNQIFILKDIFYDFAKDNENIILTDSMLKNFITHEEFDENSTMELISFFNINNDTTNNIPSSCFLLSLSYNKDKKILTIKKTKEDNTYFCTQSYKLFVRQNKIEYMKYGNFEETTVEI